MNRNIKQGFTFCPEIVLLEKQNKQITKWPYNLRETEGVKQNELT